MNLLLPFTLLLFCCITVSSFSCIDDNGEPVDYFFALKQNNAANYFYLDEHHHSDFTLSPNTMDGDEGGAIVDTLGQLYGDYPDEYGYALYNDQTDDGRASNARAHAKGVILFDDEEGFWMIHSLPRYPSRPSSGYQGLPDIKYGQTFMCVTFKTAEFDKIASQLITMWPQVYDSEMTDGLVDSLPTFNTWITTNDKGEVSSLVTLTSKGGKKFEHIGKSKRYDDDLFGGLVAPHLKDDLLTETWQNGAHKNQIPSDCSGDYSIFNVEQLTLSDGTSWRRSQDHSKWAVTMSKGSLCFGDINRQYSQYNRGGGVLCFKQTSVWNAFMKTAIEYENCDGGTTMNVASLDDGDSDGGSRVSIIVVSVSLCALAVVAVAAVIIRKRNRNNRLSVVQPSQPQKSDLKSLLI